MRVLCPSAKKLVEFLSMKALKCKRFGSHEKFINFLSAVKEPWLLLWRSGREWK